MGRNVLCLQIRYKFHSETLKKVFLEHYRSAHATMTKPPLPKVCQHPPTVTTEGDARLKIISALGDMSLVSERLSSAVNGLKDILPDQLNGSSKKRVILNQVKLIERAVIYLAQQIDLVTTHSHVTSLTKRTESRKHAADNIEGKIKSKNYTYLAVEDNKLAKMVGAVTPAKTVAAAKPGTRSAS